MLFKNWAGLRRRWSWVSIPDRKCSKESPPELVPCVTYVRSRFHKRYRSKIMVDRSWKYNMETKTARVISLDNLSNLVTDKARRWSDLGQIKDMKAKFCQETNLSQRWDFHSEIWGQKQSFTIKQRAGEVQNQREVKILATSLAYQFWINIRFPCLQYIIRYNIISMYTPPAEWQAGI